VKTLTTREFFHSPGVLKSLGPGQTFAVTDNGAPAFTVTKAGKRPRKTMADIEREARLVSPKAEPKVNFTEAIRQMKGR
jgi:hypothetical protein